ncbi:MAG: helix-turn-helix domain-containing protein [Polyangiales bacterium]|jgi:excisionase family DNA binding protein
MAWAFSRADWDSPLPSAAEDVRAALPPIVTVPEVAKVLRVSKRTVFELLELGELQDIRAVRRRGVPVRISRASVVALVRRGEGSTP